MSTTPTTTKPPAPAPKAAIKPTRSVAETREVIALARSIWSEIGRLLDKDGKIGVLDALGLMVRLKGDLLLARQGIELVPEELGELSREEITKQLGPDLLELLADILDTFRAKPAA